jgi:hypothetical protein
MANTKLTGMHARWAHILSEYDIEIRHRPGLKSSDADGLSRNPLPDDSDWTDARMDHVASDVDVTVLKALALLSCLGRDAEVSEVDESQVQAFALAPDSFFTGSEKNGDLVVAAPHANSASRDIWYDQETLHFLKEGTYSPGLSASEKDCVQHRAKGYYCLNELSRKKSFLVQAVLDKVVPRPDLRVNLNQAIHVEVGHYGVRKTYSLLEFTFFWVGMFAQVGKEVAACVACDRVKASFEVKDPELKPLPIMGIFYRWDVDLCKMPFVSADGNKYVVVMIEHFSKWVELIPFLARSLDTLLPRFESC